MRFSGLNLFWLWFSITELYFDKYTVCCWFFGNNQRSTMTTRLTTNWASSSYPANRSNEMNEWTLNRNEWTKWMNWLNDWMESKQNRGATRAPYTVNHPDWKNGMRQRLFSLYGAKPKTTSTLVCDSTQTVKVIRPNSQSNRRFCLNSCFVLCGCSRSSFWLI